MRSPSNAGHAARISAGVSQDAGMPIASIEASSRRARPSSSSVIATPMEGLTVQP